MDHGRRRAGCAPLRPSPLPSPSPSPRPGAPPMHARPRLFPPRQLMLGISALLASRSFCRLSAKAPGVALSHPTPRGGTHYLSPWPRRHRRGEIVGEPVRDSGANSASGCCNTAPSPWGDVAEHCQSLNPHFVLRRLDAGFAQGCRVISALVCSCFRSAAPIRNREAATLLAAAHTMALVAACPRSSRSYGGRACCLPSLFTFLSQSALQHVPPLGRRQRSSELRQSAKEGMATECLCTGTGALWLAHWGCNLLNMLLRPAVGTHSTLRHFRLIRAPWR